MKKLFLFIAIACLTAGMNSAQANSKLLKLLDKLEKTASAPEAPWSFSKTKVKGKTLKEMLTSYADIKGYDKEELRILLNMRADQIPETDSGENVIGITRNVDAVDFAVNDDLPAQHMKAARSQALKALFEITALGVKVGLESHSWNTCGVTMVGMIVVDVENNVVYSLTPDDTSC